jgi:MoaA/NifB/PqqE/SkfB family radical SAM enzyme
LVKIYFPDHPALQEIDIKNRLYLVYSLLRGLLLTPFFALHLSYRLADSDIIKGDVQFILSSFYFWLHKVFYYIGVFTQSLQSNFDRCDVPRSIILDLTHRCNLNCVICDIRKDKDQTPLKTDEVKRILKEAKQLGIKNFALSGGEPLLREDIFQILDYCRKLSYPVGVLTNGVVLDDDNFFEKIKPYIIQGLVTLCISFDSLKPSLHDEIRGYSGAHAKTLRVLMKLSRLKDIHPDVRVMVISIIMDRNLEEFLELLYFLKSLKVDQIQIQPILDNNLFLHQRDSVSRYWVSSKRLSLLEKTISDIIIFKRQNPLLLINSEHNLELIKKYYRRELSAQDVNCGRGIRDMLISNNGEVTTCFDSLGNVREAPLIKIWSSPMRITVQDKVRKCATPCLLPCFVE